MKTFLSWSSGKDSALALHYLRRDRSYAVESLLTNVNEHFDRVSMHGLRSELLRQQAGAIGIPLIELKLPEMPSNTYFEQVTQQQMLRLKDDGFCCAAFGDIFLGDLKLYREEQLRKVGIEGVFPLWKKDTTQLLSEFIDLGYKAITVCVNADLLDESFVGRVIDHEFINNLPSNVDPCGENGEFHTFCFDGPIFKHSIKYKIGEVVKRAYQGQPSSRFLFRDLLPYSD